MSDILANITGLVWNYPVIGLCLFSGIFFTFIRLPFIQFRSFKHAIELISGHYDSPNETGEITHFQALSAALSGTIGLGNIAGVAIAIALGGPGAVFWMWLVGILGMATKYVECALGTMYRDIDPETNEVHGGPMYYVKNGLGQRWIPLGMILSFCIALGALGAGGMFQANQAAMALEKYYNIATPVTGFVLAVLLAVVIIGGIKRIAQVTSKIVPLMCGIYVIGALVICIINIDQLPRVIELIVYDAFTGRAAAGGTLGAVLIMGVRRAVFSNEAGLGTASIAHAAVKTDYPVREGIVASVGPFIDTIVVCTATAMVIILSGYYGHGRFEVLYDNPMPALVAQNTHQIQVNSTDSASHTLIVDAQNAQVPKSSIGPILLGSNDSQGLRFEYFQESGSIDVEVYSNKRGIIGALSLPTGDGAVINPNTQAQMFSTHGFDQRQHWAKGLLSFNGDFQPDENESFTLLISSADPSTKWHIREIHSVSPFEGIELTIQAFDTFFKGFGSIFISIAVCLFAFSTMITWSYYGETALHFVLGKKASKAYKLLFILGTYFGASVALHDVLNFTDLAIGLMVIPNTIAILLLSGKVKTETQSYFAKLKAGEMTRYKTWPFKTK